MVSVSLVLCIREDVADRSVCLEAKEFVWAQVTACSLSENILPLKEFIISNSVKDLTDRGGIRSGMCNEQGGDERGLLPSSVPGTQCDIFTYKKISPFGSFLLQ